MKILKVNNLIQISGAADYKGLNLNKIVTGTQIYPPTDNSAYFYYEGDYAPLKDIQEVDEVTYQQVIEEMSNRTGDTVSSEQEIELLKQKNEELTIATVELADTVAIQNAQIKEQGEALIDLANTLAEVMG